MRLIRWFVSKLWALVPKKKVMASRFELQQVATRLNVEAKVEWIKGMQNGVQAPEPSKFYVEYSTRGNFYYLAMVEAEKPRLRLLNPLTASELAAEEEARNLSIHYTGEPEI